MLRKLYEKFVCLLTGIPLSSHGIGAREPAFIPPSLAGMGPRGHPAGLDSEMLQQAIDAYPQIRFSPISFPERTHSDYFDGGHPGGVLTGSQQAEAQLFQ